MAIRRYNADADTTITNAYKSNMTGKGSDSNMGQSDILEVFSIHAQASATSSETARVLIKFPTTDMITDTDAPGVKYYLKLGNAPHAETLAANFSMEIGKMTRFWEEGYGLDMEEYSDIGASSSSYIPYCDSGSHSTEFFHGNDADIDGDYITIPHVFDDSVVTNPGPINFGAGAFSISAWIKTKDSDAYGFIISSSTSPARWIKIDQGVIKTHFSDTTNTSTSSVTVNDDNWHHIVVTVAAGELKLYIDNNVPETYSDTAAANNFGPINIGRFGTGSESSTNHFNGSIDDVSIWNTTLDATTVAAIYNNKSPIDLTKNSGDYQSKDNLVAYWRMGDGDTLPTIMDHSASSLHGTISENMNRDSIVDGVTTCVPVAIYNLGATWNAASEGIPWTTPGGDYTTIVTIPKTSFKEGYEELEVDITATVEEWIADPSTNYGLMIKLSDLNETAKTSFYTKRFFARGTEHFFEKPVIEARWESAENDDRGRFYKKSILRSDNKNTIFLKNYVDGVLTDIPDPTVSVNPPALDSEDLDVKLYATSKRESEYTPDTLTAEQQTVTDGNTSTFVTGVYKAEITTATVAPPQLFVSWQTCDETNYNIENENAILDGCGDSGGGKLFIYHEEYITVKTRQISSGKTPTYVTAIQNLKNVYSNSETAKFRIFTRLKDWSPTIYTVATKKLESEIIEEAYYRIVRVVDDLIVVDYGTETPAYTKLSYDKDGSYFDLDMSLFEPGWAYNIEFKYKINGEFYQQPETFKFRVE